MREARQMMHDIGMSVIQDKKKVVAKLGIAGVSPRRDLLTLLTRANMDPSVPESQRLSDEEILARESALSVVLNGTDSPLRVEVPT